MFYAGIGSRKTPNDILLKMTELARMLELCGFTLRSGGARGADTAFEDGVITGRKEIYLPWKDFNNNPSKRYLIGPDAFKLAKKYHPGWQYCSDAARKFHARNCYQVFGLHLNQPAEFVLCWTPKGDVVGGTGQAIRMARACDIPVFNMGGDWDKPFYTWMEEWQASMAAPVDFKFEAEDNCACLIINEHDYCVLCGRGV